MNGQTSIETHLPPGVAEHLGYYVYLYVDPRTDKPFYVGKGKGERVLAHLKDDHDSDKVRLIAEIRAAGMEPRLEILAHRLKDEETAFRVEAAVIDVLGLDDLTNMVSGWRSLQIGRMTLQELSAFYAAKPVTITEPVILIRINKLFRKNMSDLELYEATRGLWRLGDDRHGARYAFAVFEDVVREVYQIEQWYPARTQEYVTRDLSQRDVTGRWEFKGSVAPEAIRNKYKFGSVAAYFTKGNQNPVRYVNVKPSRQGRKAGQ